MSKHDATKLATAVVAAGVALALLALCSGCANTIQVGGKDGAKIKLYRLNTVVSTDAVTGGNVVGSNRGGAASGQRRIVETPVTAFPIRITATANQVTLEAATMSDGTRAATEGIQDIGRTAAAGIVGHEVVRQAGSVLNNGIDKIE